MTQKSLVSQLLVYEFIVHILLHYATYAHANSMQLVNIYSLKLIWEVWYFMQLLVTVV